MREISPPHRSYVVTDQQLIPLRAANLGVSGLSHDCLGTVLLVSSSCAIVVSLEHCLRRKLYADAEEVFQQACVKCGMSFPMTNLRVRTLSS
jgi:hypothetical protein